MFAGRSNRLLPRLLLDTHILIRWMRGEYKKLSREQLKALEVAERQGEPFALSAISLLEMAMLASSERLFAKTSLEELFEDLIASPLVHILPITYEVALDAAALGPLRDPGDRAIAATARVHRLKLVTSDQRIIDSGLVPVVD